MAVKLHRAGVQYAQERIKSSEYDSFDTDWSEVKPTTDEVLHFIDAHDMQEYGQWFLAINDNFSPEVKEHYVYPHGDLKLVQKCALEVAAHEAGKKGFQEIVDAANRLLTLIDKQD